MKIDYKAIAKTAEELGACNATSDLMRHVHGSRYDEANWLIIQHRTWIRRRPGMKKALPLKVWRTINNHDLDTRAGDEGCKLELMKAFGLKQHTEMRLSYRIVSNVVMPKKDKLWYFDVYVEDSVEEKCYILIKDLITDKKYPPIYNASFKDVASGESIIKLCLKHIKGIDNEAKL